MKNLFFALIAVSVLSGCVNLPLLFETSAQEAERHKVEREQARIEREQKLGAMTPEQRDQFVAREKAVSDCVGYSNVYGGSTPQGHRAAFNHCMYQKGM